MIQSEHMDVIHILIDFKGFTLPEDIIICDVNPL